MKTPHKCRVPGLNIGCTSFIIPDYYVPAIRECVHYADDVALLLLEAGECGKELITPAEIRELAGIAADAGVTWNVHLPTDGGFATEESSRRYTENIIRAIDLTRELEPHTWVMHVVTDHIPGPDMRPHLTECETERILRSLEQITPHLPAPECLALENLERHPTDYLDKLVAATPHSRCFDIGHVWKEGLRPENFCRSGCRTYACATCTGWKNGTTNPCTTCLPLRWTPFCTPCGTFISPPLLRWKSSAWMTS